MPKILNLVIEDRSDPRNTTIMVEPFLIKEGIGSNPEKALRDAVREFVASDSEESKKALSYASGYYNWGDAMSSIPEALFEKHGLIRFHQNAVDVVVNHDEILCNSDPDETGDNSQTSILINVKKLISEAIIDGEKDIDYWQRGCNLFAENVADEIAERNDKLRELLGMETITADFIENLIAAEKSDELIVIYESILDELIASDEMGGRNE